MLFGDGYNFMSTQKTSKRKTKLLKYLPRMDGKYLDLEAYKEVGIKYISPNSEEQKDYFHSEMKWEDAINISSSSALVVFDSMILNALNSSRFSFAISSDMDLAHATLSDPSVKDIVAPDSLT